MLRRIARIVRWQDVVPAGDGGAEDSTHGQLTEQNAHPRARFLATVPEEPEDDEEPAGGHGEVQEGMNEQPVVDAAMYAGYCRDHRGKLQSMWELCEDVAQDAQDGGEDECDNEAGQVFRAAAETRGDPNLSVNRAGAQARPARPQAQGQPSAETPVTTPWPADILVTGPLELRLRATRRSSSDKRATCTIQQGIMTFSSALRPGAEMAVLAEVPVSDIVATIVPDQTRKFSICYPELIDSSQVWCCAQDQSTRDEWLAVLHRLGVDLYREDDDGQIWLVRQGVQAQPGRTDLLLRDDDDDDVEDGTVSTRLETFG